MCIFQLLYPSYLSSRISLRLIPSKFHTSNRHFRLLIHTFGNWFRQRTPQNEDLFFLFGAPWFQHCSGVTSLFVFLVLLWIFHWATLSSGPPPISSTTPPGKGSASKSHPATSTDPHLTLSLSSLPPSPSASLPLSCRHTALFSPSQPVGFRPSLVLPAFLRPTGHAGNGSERCMHWGALLSFFLSSIPAVVLTREIDSSQPLSPFSANGRCLFNLPRFGLSRTLWIWPISLCTSKQILLIL